MQVISVRSLNNLTDEMLDHSPYINNIVVDSFGVIIIPDDAP